MRSSEGGVGSSGRCRKQLTITCWLGCVWGRVWVGERKWWMVGGERIGAQGWGVVGQLVGTRRVCWKAMTTKEVVRKTQRYGSRLSCALNTGSSEPSPNADQARFNNKNTLARCLNIYSPWDSIETMGTSPVVRFVYRLLPQHTLSLIHI